MKRFYSLFLLLAMAAMCHAVPAKPVRRTLVTADGRTLEATLHGDEHLKFYITDDGVRLIERLDGRVEYLDEAEFATLSARRQTNIQNARSMNSAPARAGGLTGGAYEGVKRALVLLVNFRDVKMTVGTKALYEEYMNKPGYSDYGMSGSVRDYFLAQSYGRFTMDFDVAGPYDLRYNRSYYGAHTEDGANDAHAADMVLEALQAADADVDYSRYDWDGDGEVDQVYIIYAGYGEAQGGPAETIWPHASNIGSYGLVLDGVRLGSYACGNELRGNRGTLLDGNGTLCHEFSHCLGLPDDYDVNYSGNYGTGNFDLMCSGSYNNDGCTPAGYNAWQRWACGWLTPEEITSERSITAMQPLSEVPEAYILYNEANRNEYYLLENRQQQGYDAYLKGHGLMILHVDFDENSWNQNVVNSGSVQRMVYVPADGVLSATSESGDPFPGSGGVTSLTDYTTPAATLNNRNTDGLRLMHKAVEDIQETADGTVAMLVCAPVLATPVLRTSNVTTSAFTVAWDAVERATTYEVTVNKRRLKASPAEAEILNESFQGCYKSTVGFTDISGKLNEYLTVKGFTGSKLYQTPDLLRIGSSTASGYLRTPVLEALQTKELTIAMKVKPMKTTGKTQGNVRIVTNTAATTQDLPFEVAGEDMIVLHSTVPFSEIFRVDIEPNTGIYLQGLRLYDGNFTADEIDAAQARAMSQQENVYSTQETSFTLGGLDASYQYDLSIRAINDRQQSTWSDVYPIVLDATGIGNVLDDADAAQADTSEGNCFNLSGQRVNINSGHGIYILNGKVVIR